MDHVSSPKVALLLCGHLRTWEICRPSFLKFMEGTDYDIFIHTYTMVKGYHPYIQNSCNISDNLAQEAEIDIINKLGIPYAKLVIENEDFPMEEIKAVENKDIECYQWPNYGPYDDLQVIKGKGISIRTYLQYRKFRLCNELRKDYEKTTGVKYDYVLKLRMDLDYTNASTNLFFLLQNVKSADILTSSSNTQPNDRIYIGLSEDIDKLVQSLGCAKIPLDREYNPHEYLLISLISSGLSFNPCIHNLLPLRL